MLSSIFQLFHHALAHAEADADPAGGWKQRLAGLPAQQAEVLAANDHLRGFLAAVIRHHEEGRMAEGAWPEIVQFLTGRRAALPPSVAHLGPQWPGARQLGGPGRTLALGSRGRGWDP